jgi:glycosyltransferase involved in cell wall biosynthesis
MPSSPRMPLPARVWSAGLDRLACAGSGGRVVPVQSAPARPPRISVVIPCYKYGHYLSECVESVLGQAGVDVDVVIVDDASPDGSGEVAEEIAAASGGRVRTLRHERNQGHIATYNDGLAEAEGKYVTLLSADDLLPPGSLGRAAALLEAHPRVGLAYGHAVSFSDVIPAASRTRPSAWTIWAGRDWLGERFKRGRNCIRSPELVLRASVQREIGGYRADLPHTGDLEMWIRAAAIADVGYVGGADQAWYRVHAANMHSETFRSGKREGMVSDMRERLRAFESAADEIRGEVPDADALLDSARRALAVEALTLAVRAFHWGIAESWPVEDLTEFALASYPEARRLRQWRALPLRRRLGDGWRRNPLFLGHEIALRAEGAARSWRLQRAGL